MEEKQTMEIGLSEDGKDLVIQHVFTRNDKVTPEIFLFNYNDICKEILRLEAELNSAPKRHAETMKGLEEAIDIMVSRKAIFEQHITKAKELAEQNVLTTQKTGE